MKLEQVEMFKIRSKLPDDRVNPEYQKAYDARRAKDPARVASVQARYDRMRKWLDEQKSGPCADCGVRYPPYVMEFDHVRGKKLFGIATAWSRSRDRVLEEIAKCDLVCSNCHRERTHQYESLFGRKAPPRVARVRPVRKRRRPS